MTDSSLYHTNFTPPEYSRDVSHADLAKALVLFCIQDGNIASEDISERLTGIQAKMQEIQTKLCENEETMPMSMEVASLLGNVSEALIALQFFDRVAQRMEHAIAVIEGVQSTKDMCKRFTMEDERSLYEALVKGANVNQAVNIAKQTLVAAIQKKGEDIELF